MGWLSPRPPRSPDGAPARVSRTCWRRIIGEAPEEVPTGVAAEGRNPPPSPRCVGDGAGYVGAGRLTASSTRSAAWIPLMRPSSALPLRSSAVKASRTSLRRALPRASNKVRGEARASALCSCLAIRMKIPLWPDRSARRTANSSIDCPFRVSTVSTDTPGPTVRSIRDSSARGLLHRRLREHPRAVEDARRRLAEGHPRSQGQGQQPHQQWSGWVRSMREHGRSSSIVGGRVRGPGRRSIHDKAADGRRPASGVRWDPLLPEPIRPRLRHSARPGRSRVAAGGRGRRTSSTI